jgi:RNA polymerase sigma-70 factor (TIGR02957 family)
MTAEEELYEELRPRAFAIAYRMLGSVAEAEDVVQEGLMRLHAQREAGEEIESPQAYLSTVVTRLAIDELRSARVRRETYVGEWLPEPIVADPGSDPAEQAELADSLSMAFLVVLESLTPEQRAVFLLREVFDYPYDRIAGIVGRSEDASRQLAARARRRVAEDEPRFETTPEQEERLATEFFAAMGDGDLESLERVLAADVELHCDGGGNAPALARPISGRTRAARTLVAWSKVMQRVGGIEIHRAIVNGQPGATMSLQDGRLISVMALEFGDGQVRAVRSIVNPDKLEHLGPLADVQELVSRLQQRP